MNSYYRVFAEVDLDAIAYNTREIKKHISEDVKLMAVIKADGYGHGAVPVSKTLIDNGAYGLAVAVVEEGIALRKSGIDAPVIVLGYAPEDQLRRLVKYDLIQTVFKYSMAESLSRVAVKLNKTAKIHIKIDTGMGRIGFFANEESIKIIKKISELPNIIIEGIFTHFSRADERDKNFSNKQVETFEKFIGMLEKESIHIPIKHMANSAGIIDITEARYNMVRAGIILYGLYPSDEVIKENILLRPALQLKSHIIFIKEVEEGTSISYGAAYVTTRKTKIATIPVGYGDGYSRELSSNGRVLIRGQYAPIIGRICMDQFMVDVTNIDGVCDGDEVILIGKQGDNCITVEEIANLTNTINYEVICGLGKRIPRVYKSQKKVVNSIDYFDVF